MKNNNMKNNNSKIVFFSNIKADCTYKSKDFVFYDNPQHPSQIKFSRFL